MTTRRRSAALAVPLAAMLAGLVPALPARAGVDEVVNAHILPGLARFDTVAEDMATEARADCTAEAVRPNFHDAFDAWVAIEHLRLGPGETAILPIVFWPDKRGFTQRTLAGLVADEDPVGRDPAAYAEVSAAARGFFALEALLYRDDHAGYAADSYTCALVSTIAQDLSRQARDLRQAWVDFVPTLTSAGAADNATYLSEQEAQRALYTQLLAGLEFDRDQRLGRPMGTFERPRPERAEAWRGERPLRNIRESLRGLRDLARELSDTPIPQTEAAFDRAFEAADRIEDPTFQRAADPAERLRMEILQQRIRAVGEAAAQEIGEGFGISPGFNSMDGD